MHQRREDGTQRYVDETLAAFGRIDGFFNNAGIAGKQNLTEDFSADEFDRVVSIILRGVFLGLEKVLKVMREQGSGAVVNTASVGGIRASDVSRATPPLSTASWVLLATRRWSMASSECASTLSRRARSGLRWSRTR